MKAFVTQKVEVRDTNYGYNIGGSVSSVDPLNSIIVNQLDNVTQVVEDAVNGVYDITHKTRTDTEHHVSHYSIEHYNVMVTGG